MKLIATGRQGGKTEQMLAWLRDAPEGEHRVLVSHSREEAMRLLRDNADDLESWQFVTPEEVTPDAWSGVLLGRGGRIVLGFDNLDLILPRLVGRTVGAVSMTVEDPASLRVSMAPEPDRT